MNLMEIRDKIKSRKMTISEAEEIMMKYDFNGYYDALDDRELEALIYICNDIYTYSESGNVVMSDTGYDDLMNAWIARGHTRIIYPDSLDNGWQLVKHKHPGLVGSLDKVYDFYALLSWASGLKPKEILEIANSGREFPHPQYSRYAIAPKYDGVSASVELKDGELVCVLTRKDGYVGQDITALIRESLRHQDSLQEVFRIAYSMLYDEPCDSDLDDGFYKVELLMNTDNLRKLQEEMKERGVKPYANRRSAVSGIVNTPKNIDLGNYITIIPLLFESAKSGKVYYAPPSSIMVKFGPNDSAKILCDQCKKMLESLRNPYSEYPVRIDGVVAYPIDPSDFNPNDYMDKAMAYKINTHTAPARIRYVYVSVGPLGKSVPMLKIFPTEVNETIVEDISLGSWDKFMNMRLKEEEIIEVYSAGDVIPQAIPLDPRPECDSPLLRLDTICPYCKKNLTRIKNEYWCMNDDCDRKNAGRIINFVSKIGGKNIGEGIITNLYDMGLCRSIEDLFTNTVDRLLENKYDGWEKTSINNMKDELDRLRETPIEVSKFIGSLGIKLIGRRKCRGIFKNITIEEVLKLDPLRLEMKVAGYDKVGSTTSQNFVEFITQHKSEIKSLMKIFNLIPDKKYKGSICFTGFRDESLTDTIEDLGYEVTDSINDDCIALIAKSTNTTSGKAKNALKKGISIVHLNDVEELLKELRK